MTTITTPTAPATPAAPAVTLDDVRAALGNTDPRATNAGAIRQRIGRGSLRTIQAHLEVLRAERAAAEVQRSGVDDTAPTAPPPPEDWQQTATSIWRAAWHAAQARVSHALARASAQIEAQRLEIESLRAEVSAAQEAADIAAADATDLRQARVAAEAEAVAARDQVRAVLAERDAAMRDIDAERAQYRQAAELAAARWEVERATLQSQIDRANERIADLRMALASGRDSANT